MINEKSLLKSVINIFNFQPFLKKSGSEDFFYIIGPEKPLTPGGGIVRPAIFSGIGGVPKQDAKEPASSRGSGSRRRRPVAG
jgi:hypothetical protein